MHFADQQANVDMLIRLAAMGATGDMLEGILRNLLREWEKLCNTQYSSIVGPF